MILTDRTNTFTMTPSDDRDIPIINSNSVVTIGGVVKSQADSQRLKITCRMRLTQTEVAELSAIITNFSAELYFTPQRKLWDKATNGEIRVVVASYTVDDWLYSDEPVYHVTLELDEVL